MTPRRKRLIEDMTVRNLAPEECFSPVQLSEEIRPAVANGWEFIGLYWTEFDFFGEGKQPDEESLVADYSLVLKSAKGGPVTFCRSMSVSIKELGRRQYESRRARPEVLS